MAATASESDFRSSLGPAERSLELANRIDPGFVNHRLAQLILGPKGMEIVDANAERVPDMPAPLRQVRIDWFYSEVLLAYCRVNKVPTLRTAITDGRDRIVVAATEEVGPFPGIYREPRGHNRIKLDGFPDLHARLEYSTEHVWSSTSKSNLRKGCLTAFVGVLEWEDERTVVVRPAVMGPPWVDTEEPDPEMRWPWYGEDFFEQFVEDIDEFSAVKGEPLPSEIEEMRDVSESAFKACVGEILGDVVVKDWGGEQADHYSAHLHLDGRPTTAGFLFKGPARFRPMGLNSLGKNNDQIYRLAQLPANLLVVQHCHEILPPVRATLRAFAVQPGNPRRYCLMDGRDSLRLLRAYNKLDRARELSALERAARAKRPTPGS
jgi:hypothetical protein